MEVAQHPIQYQLSSAPPASGVPVCLDFPSAPTFFIAKTQQQPFKLINCLLLIAPDRLEDDTGALQRALQPGKMSLFCALAEGFYAVGSLLQ